MKLIHVKTSRPYDVVIGSGLLCDAGTYIGEVSKANRILLISDDNVYPIYGDEVKRTITEAGFSVTEYVIPHGEEHKNWMTLGKILEKAAECGLTREDLVVTLGGGVIGDIGGFAAAVYMRGIDFIQIPTTLLSAVDASVGGKTAIDLEHGKNLAGAFWQPALVLCDCDTLRTLPKEQFENGMAEVIKYGFISDESILETVEQDLNETDLSELVYKCLVIKRDMVEADERESGVRKLLNFGHTVGHAVEKQSGYSLGHGCCVSIGMVYETAMAERLGICDVGLSDRLATCLGKYNLPTSTEFDFATLVELMKMDKKNRGSKISVVLPIDYGKCRIEAFEPEEILTLLR